MGTSGSGKGHSKGQVDNNRGETCCSHPFRGVTDSGKYDPKEVTKEQNVTSVSCLNCVAQFRGSLMLRPGYIRRKQDYPDTMTTNTK